MLEVAQVPRDRELQLEHRGGGRAPAARRQGPYLGAHQPISRRAGTEVDRAGVVDVGRGGVHRVERSARRGRPRSEDLVEWGRGKHGRIGHGHRPVEDEPAVHLGPSRQAVVPGDGAVHQVQAQRIAVTVVDRHARDEASTG